MAYEIKVEDVQLPSYEEVQKKIERENKEA
jgi:hypothetical protein